MNVKSKLLRVTQLDAIELDKEIFKIFIESFYNAFKYFKPGFAVSLQPEIKLTIKILILYYSIVKQNATFGQQLLLIKYETLSNTGKFFHLLFSFFDYFKERIELSTTSDSFTDIVRNVELLVTILNIVNLSAFLRSGMKPKLIDRVLNLNQVYVKENIPRQFENKYLTRELVWNGFIELLIFIMPFINYHKMRRILRNARMRSKDIIPRCEERNFNNFTKCPHCSETPILPHHMGCEHIFCYVCLKGNQLADSQYECPSCYYTDKICEKIIM